MVKLIEPAWKDTLKFLAGTLKKKEAVTLIKELSQVSLNPHSQDYRQSLDFIVQCAWENKHTHHLVSETIGNLKTSGIFSNLKRTAKYWIWPALLIGGLLAGGGAYYWEKKEAAEKAELLAKGRKECEEIKFSSDLIECFRYYTFDDGKIKELGYLEGFRPRGDSLVLEDYGKDFKTYEVKKSVVWRLKPDDCSGAINLRGTGTVELNFEQNHRWEFRYHTRKEAEEAESILRNFCKSKVTYEEEEDEGCPEFASDDEESPKKKNNGANDPDFEASPRVQELEKLLKKGRPDCGSVSYSTQLIKCEDYEEYIVDEEGERLYEYYLDYQVLPPNIVDDGRDDGLTVCTSSKLVWEISSNECLRAYDAGAGVVIMEMKDGRVWEFKYNDYHRKDDESEIKIQKVVQGLQDFCQDKKAR